MKSIKSVAQQHNCQTTYRPNLCGTAQRLLALNQTHAMSETQLHAWCREKGLFAHQLKAWGEVFCSATAPESREARTALRELQVKHDRLPRELRRKEKALAEAAALLVLQKKFQALWEDEDKACAVIRLDARTVQRWRHPGHQDGDLRLAGKRRIAVPANKFSHAERQAALALINSNQFKDLPPSQIVPRLAEQGLYVASGSTLYRLCYVKSASRPIAA